jgi:hypothetical protein
MKIGIILRIIPRILCKIDVQRVLSQPSEADFWPLSRPDRGLARVDKSSSDPGELLIVAEKIPSTKGRLTGCLKANGSGGWKPARGERLLSGVAFRVL